MLKTQQRTRVGDTDWSVVRSGCQQNKTTARVINDASNGLSQSYSSLLDVALENGRSLPIPKIRLVGHCRLRAIILVLRAYLSFKEKQETEYTLAIAAVPCALNELLVHRLVVAKQLFHVLSAAPD